MDEYYESFDDARIKVSLGPDKFEKGESLLRFQI